METGRTPALADPIPEALRVAFPLVRERRRGIESVAKLRVIRPIEQQFDRAALPMIRCDGQRTRSQLPAFKVIGREDVWERMGNPYRVSVAPPADSAGPQHRGTPHGMPQP
jgi:hypothetical protein